MSYGTGESIHSDYGSSFGQFSVIIVNYNGESTLELAVKSALNAGVAPSQVIVVDNGSHDKSINNLKEAHRDVQVVLKGCNAGFASAVNSGLRMARSEFAILLNNDATLDVTAPSAFLTAFQNDERVALAGGQLRYPDGRIQSSFAPLPDVMQEVIPTNLLKWLKPDRYLRKTASMQQRQVESVFGACLALRIGAMEEIGLLDEDFFFYYEEIELCYRARAYGWSVVYVPSACATHAGGLTANKFRARAQIEMQRSKLLYFKKCHGARVHAVMTGILVVRTFVNSVSGTLACIVTAGLKEKVRGKTAAYLVTLAWHLMGHPKTWGLPGKCVR
jgi:GT2 family glycosyltransferase